MIYDGAPGGMQRDKHRWCLAMVAIV